MKRIFRATLFALALFVGTSPNRAAAWDGVFPYKVEAGANAYFRVQKQDQTQPQRGPWYLYWPLEAHFQQTAPTGYPGWPGQYSLPPNFQAPKPTPLPHFQPPAPTPYPQFQPPVPTPLPLQR